MKMEYTEFTKSISNTISKELTDENLTHTEPQEGLPPTAPSSITNEQIVENQWILETYQVTSKPVHGGMGSVWRVHHKGWNVDLAMKRPQPKFFSEGSRQRKEHFKQECENWIKLGLHPNIVSCYYIREVGGVPSIFSEWMEGGSLKDRIRDGALYVGTEEEVRERILGIAIAAERGLAYSNENGLIHQDMKPGNLLLTKEWEAKVADFGLAKANASLEEGVRGFEEHPEDPIQTRHVSGYTLEYCPQEQTEGEKAAAWMDLYAWALTVLEMYAGERLWKTGAKAKACCRDYFGMTKVPVPEKLQDLLERCLTEKESNYTAVTEKLEEIWLDLTGREYPRPQKKAASDTADSLNNRALSFLDLGMEEEARKLWDIALGKEPAHVEARWNRELFLVRRQEKFDFQAIEELNRVDATKRAGVAKAIEAEWKQKENMFPDPNLGSTDGEATGAVLAGEYLYFSFGNKFTKSIPHPYIKRVLLDGGDLQEEDTDPLAQLRMSGERIWEIALVPGGFYAVIILSNHTACLYDLRERSIVKISRKLPAEILDSLFYSDFMEPRCLFSPDGTYLAIFTRGAVSRTLILQIPSLKVLGTWEMNYHFTCFCQDNTPVLRKRAGKSADILYAISADGDMEELQRFHPGLDNPDNPAQGMEWPIPLAAVLLFENSFCKEKYWLDETFQKKELTNRLFLSDTQYVKFYDPEQHLLYTNPFFKAKEKRMAVWDMTTQNCLFTIADCPGGDILYDKRKNRILLWKAAGGKTSWSAPAPVPKPGRGETAGWQLSQIVTVNKRMEEEAVIDRMLGHFREQYQKGDYYAALSLYKEARKVPGFYGSPQGEEMESLIDQAANRHTLRTVRKLPDQEHWPLSADYLVRKEGDLYVRMDPKRLYLGVDLFREDETLVSHLTFPPFVRHIEFRQGRILAFNELLQQAVYNMEGELLEAPESGWEEQPPGRTGKYPSFRDLDPTGTYLLYHIPEGEDPFGNPCVSGFYVKNLKTGQSIRLTDFEYENRRDMHCRYGFLNDQTCLLRTGNRLSRFRAQDGKKLYTYPAGGRKDVRFYVYPDSRQERFLLFEAAKNGESVWYAFDKDNRLLFREKSRSGNHFSWIPNGRFLLYTGENTLQIRDVTGNKTLYTQPHTNAKQLGLSPDGRYLYIQVKEGEVQVYRLEYEYEVFGRF